MIEHLLADLSLFLFLSEFFFASIFSEDFAHFLPELWPQYDDWQGNDDVEEISPDLFEDHVCKEVYWGGEEELGEDHVREVRQYKDNSEDCGQTVGVGGHCHHRQLGGSPPADHLALL